MRIKFTNVKLMIGTGAFPRTRLVRDQQFGTWKVFFDAKYQECGFQLIAGRGHVRTFPAIASVKKALNQLGCNEPLIVINGR